MTARDFTLWLKGYAEGINTFDISAEQWEVVLAQLEQVEIGVSTVTAKSQSNSIMNTTNSNTTTTYGRPQDSVTFLID